MSSTESIHVRLSSAERNALESAAVRSNKTRSDVVRELIMGLQISNDLKRAQADEARAIRLAMEAEVESLRRQLSQALLDLRSDLRDDIRKSVVATVEAITGKKAVMNGGAK